MKKIARICQRCNRRFIHTSKYSRVCTRCTRKSRKVLNATRRKPTQWVRDFEKKLKAGKFKW